MLDRLDEHGLVQRIDLGDGIVRYEPAREAHHHHLVCGECGKVEPFADQKLERAIEAVEERSGYSVVAHEVVLRGRAPTVGTDGAHAGRQVALGGALLQDAKRRDRRCARGPGARERRAGEAVEGRARRRHRRGLDRHAPPDRRRHRHRGQARLGHRRRQALRRDARVGRAQRARPAAAPPRATARRRPRRAPDEAGAATARRVAPRPGRGRAQRAPRPPPAPPAREGGAGAAACRRAAHR